MFAISDNFGATVSVVCLLIAAPAQSEETFLTFDLKRPLTQEQRSQLMELLAPGASNVAIHRGASGARTLDEICDPEDFACVAALLGAERELLRPDLTLPGLSISEELERSLSRERFLSLPRAAMPDGSGSDYVPLPGSDPILPFLHSQGLVPAMAGKTTAKTLFLPVEPNEAPGNHAAFIINRNAESELAAIDFDLKRNGRSLQTIVFGSHVSRKDIDAFVTSLSNGQSAVPRKSAKNFDIQFSSGPGCTIKHPNWPFNVPRLKALLDFNRSVMESMGVDHFHRAKINILDTGISRKLMEHEAFFPFMDVDLTTLLYPERAFDEDRTADAECLYYRGGDFGSAYGYGALPTAARACDRSPPDPQSLIVPIISDGVKDEDYLPDHGGYVSVLAAGGPDLILSDLDLHRHIGLSFSRVMHEHVGEDSKPKLAAKTTHVKEAIETATLREIHFLQLSLSVKKDSVTTNQLADIMQGFGGLTFVAAGNTGKPLSEAKEFFPSKVAHGDTERVLIVGALERVPGSDEEVRLWEKSATSIGDLHVDIAAPGAEIWSLDMDGNPMCTSGTSAAAPLVTFVAGLLHSYGYHGADEVERRILGTARKEPALEGKVEQNRALDEHTALDIFFDQIWKDPTNERPIRARILPQEHAEDGLVPIVPICDPATGNGVKGLIDVRRLILWDRIGTDPSETFRATVWQKRAGTNSFSPLDKSCSVSEAQNHEVRFCNLETGKIEMSPLSEIRRIVPSRLRRGVVPAIKLLLNDNQTLTSSITEECLK